MFSKKEYVYEVYKEKSFSKAAKKLYISQPSLSASIRRLEEKVGYPIFDRSISPIGLTECGEQYIATLEQIQVMEQDFEKFIDDFKNLKTGSLSIGGTNLFSSYILPPLITAFTEKFPHIQIDLREESTVKLEKQILEGTLDLMIDNFEFDHMLMERKFYKSERLLLVVPNRFEITKTLKAFELTKEDIIHITYLSESKEAIPLQLCKQLPFIFLKHGNDTNKRSVKICKNYGIKPKVILNLEQQMTAYNVACSGMGACFASDLLIRYSMPHPEVCYYKLSDKECDRNVYFYHKKGRYLTTAMSAFLDMV